LPILRLVPHLKVSGFTATIAVVALLLVTPLLLTNWHDETYSCHAGALVDVLHPEPQMGADFRREVAFDSGYACDQEARRQVEAAGVIVTAALLAIVVRARRASRQKT